MPLDRDGLARRLAAARGPALVIEPASARLLAANQPGAHFLGHDPGTDGPLPLDSAMPAIMDLRRAVQNGAAVQAAAVPALVFWTPRGMQRLQSRIDVIAYDGVSGPVVLVEIVPIEDEPQVSRANLPLPPEGASQQRAPQPAAPGAIRRAIEPEAIDPPAPRATAPHDRTTARPQVSVSATATPPAPPAATPPLHDTHLPSARRSAMPAPPMPPTSPITPPVRTDHDTLKAIARQILAGQRASPAAALNQPSTPRTALQPPLPEPSRPAHANGSAPPRSRRLAGTPSPLSSMPAAARPPGSDVRRSAPHDQPQPAPSPTRSQPPASGLTARQAVDAATPAAGRTPDRTTADTAHEPPRAQLPAKTTLQLQTPVAIGACDAAAGNRNAMKPGAKSGTTPPPTQSPQSRQPEEPHRRLAARRAIIRRLAHELKTPVGAIMSAAEVMKDERLGPIGDDRYLRYARDIFLSASHALDVIERTLSGTQATPGPGEMSFTNLDLDQLVTDIVSSIEHLADHAGVELDTQLSRRLPLVIADATSVRQIVLNMLTNALKFTPRGGRVAITTKVAADAALQLAVTDTGPGMTEATIAEVMRKTTEDPTSPRPGGGHGIGLPLALTLAHANGAELSIARGTSGGTCVTLAFPASRQIPV